MNRSERGMTLPEILVVCALLGILSTCLYNTLLPGIRAWKRSESKVEIQRSGFFALRQISEELRGSDIESVTIFHNTYKDGETGQVLAADAISFLSPSCQGAGIQYNEETGKILWQKHGIFYLDAASHNLYLQEDFLPNPTDEPKRLQMTTFSPDPCRDSVVARKIYTLSFQATGDPDKGGAILKNPITFGIGIKIQDSRMLLQSGVSTVHNQE